MASEKHARETYLPLLQDAQAYLKFLVDDKVPNSLLAASWDDFYRVYDDLIRRFVIAQGVPRCDVDDCVQEVWSEVATRLYDFDRPADRPGLRAWLYTVVRSKATNVFRKKARHRADSLEESTLVAGDEADDTQPDPAARYEQQWEEAIADSVLAELSKELSATNARILKMRLIEHRSVDEVIAELGLSAEQVYARQHRMMKKLKARVTLYTGQPLESSSE